MKHMIKKIVQENIEVASSLSYDEIAHIEKAARLIIAALRRSGKVIACGNGGSACDSLHFAAELVGRFQKDRKALCAMALVDNAAAVTAIANDFGYEKVFARQLEAVGRAGDVLIAISTSGNSSSVLEAVRKARALRLTTIGLSGGSGGSLKRAVDLAIIVPTKSTPRIQESHVMILHIICELIEKDL